MEKEMKLKSLILIFSSSLVYGNPTSEAVWSVYVRYLLIGIVISVFVTIKITLKNRKGFRKYQLRQGFL